MRAVFLAAAASLLAAPGCQTCRSDNARPEPTTPLALTEVNGRESAPAPAAAESGSSGAAGDPPPLGPVPQAASPSDHEGVLRRLLQGELDAGALPYVITDTNREYEARRFDRLTTERVAEPAFDSHPQAGPLPKCDPPYVLDAQGQRHFKPECF